MERNQNKINQITEAGEEAIRQIQELLDMINDNSSFSVDIEEQNIKMSNDFKRFEDKIGFNIIETLTDEDEE